MTDRFEIRLCLNPECGLRYPVTDASQFGERCPACLSQTVAVAEGGLELEGPVQGDMTQLTQGFQAVLDNVRSAWNVGSIFRTAEGFGVGHLHLCGITPTPEIPDVRKTSLGAEELVGWSAHKNAVKQVECLKAEGRAIWALESTGSSTPLETRAGSVPAGMVLVVGNEQAGVDPGVIQLADQVVHLEIRGRKRSFNVAVTFAVAAHIIGRK